MVKTLLAFIPMLVFSLSVTAQCSPGGGGSGGTSSFSGGTSSFSGVTSSISGGAGAISSSLSLGHTQNQFASKASGLNSLRSNLLSYEQVKGSPFLNDEAIEGVLVLNNGNVIENVPMQMDLYTHEVIATNDSGKEILLDNRFYKEIRLPFEGEELVFRRVNEKHPEKFYEVLYDDAGMIFFKERDVTLKESQSNGIVEQEARFRNRTNYFIKHGEDGEIAKVRLKKKDIFPLIPDSELIAMQAYAKKKGIKFKDESDYVAFLGGDRE